MSDALRMGLMGAASGFLQGMHQNWAQGQEDIRTERLLRARKLEQEALMRLQNNIKPPETRQRIEGDQIVTEEWNVDTAGPSEQWSGQFSELSRAQAPRKSKLEEIKSGDTIRTVRRYEDGSEEEVATAPRYKPAGESSSPRKQAFVPREGGEGQTIMIGPDDEVPPGYVPANSALANPSGGASPAAIRKEIAKEVRELDEDALRAKLNEFGVKAGPEKTLADARRELVDLMTADALGAPPSLMGGNPSPKPEPKTDTSKPPRLTEAQLKELMAEANKAIQAGADPEKVKQRLRDQYGIEVQ